MRSPSQKSEQDGGSNASPDPERNRFFRQFFIRKGCRHSAENHQCAGTISELYRAGEISDEVTPIDKPATISKTGGEHIQDAYGNPEQGYDPGLFP